VIDDYTYYNFNSSLNKYAKTVRLQLQRNQAMGLRLGIKEQLNCEPLS
jgi:hypothetical protein